MTTPSQVSAAVDYYVRWLIAIDRLNAARVNLDNALLHLEGEDYKTYLRMAEQARSDREKARNAV